MAIDMSGLLKPTVATMTPHFQELEQKRELVRDLMGGTDRMKAAGEKWLLKYPAEEQDSYTMRLGQNILTNFVEQAVVKAVSKLLAKEIVLKEVPDRIMEVCENIDLQGKGINPFMYDRASQAFQDGISYILIDMPKADGVVTEADAKAKGIRPYAVPVNAADLLEVLTEMIDGVITITRIRIRETKLVQVGEWGQAYLNQVRVFRLIRELDAVGKEKRHVMFEIYREDEKKEWVSVEKGDTTFTTIPLIPIYANQTGFYEGSPVFQATAELNLRHWRSMSEQINALAYGRFAMLSATGIGSDAQITVGPSKIQRSTSSDTKFGYIESNGAGLDQGWKDLKNIEESVEAAVATMRIENQGRVTATAASLEHENTSAALKAIAMRMSNSTEQMFKYFAEMLGMDSDKVGQAEFNTDFGAKKGTDTGLQELGKAVTSRILSGKSFIRNLIWRGEMPPDFDFELNKAEIEDDPILFPTPTAPIAGGTTKPPVKPAPKPPVK